MPRWDWAPHAEWWQLQMAWQQLMAWAQRQRAMTPAQQAEAKRVHWRFDKWRNRVAKAQHAWRR